MEQDQEHQVYGGDISEMDTDFEMYRDDESEDVENNKSKDLEESVEIEVEAGAPGEMQAKVEKEMGSAQDFKENPELKKTDGEGESKLNIPGLQDAYFAATTSSKDCTLILTQGKRAKTLAMYGLSVVSRGCYGVFPLDGSKLFNVRNSNRKKLQNSAEFQNIKKILGLEFKKIYENVEELRYGRLMIMADQDNDGSVFKGLLINFLHFFWPSLLKVTNFLRDFIPPIVVASPKETSIEKFYFYSMANYVVWKNKLGNKATKYRIKYRKGLASNETEELKEYFANLSSYTKNFVWVDDEDGDAIELVFGKMKTGKREHWIQALQTSDSNIRYRDFIYKELVAFSNQTSIPSIVDGLNLGQRKILFCAFKKRIIEPIRVSEFRGYVSVESAYHDDDTRLVETIISMAQNSVGKNKIYLLLRDVQDHSGAKCIKLSPITRYIFREVDDRVLNYLNDDGQFIEPEWFIPIIPIVLVNGSNGEGIGWSTSIPEYKPRDIILNLIRLLEGEEMVPMIPRSKSGYTRERTFNLHLLDENGVVKNYYTPERILKAFYEFRLQFYEKWMTERLCELEKDLKLLEYQQKYISLVRGGSVKLCYRTLAELLKDLEDNGLEKEAKVEEEVATGEDNPEGNASKMVAAAGYSYLLSMDGLSFSDEKIAELEKKRKHKQSEYDLLSKEKPNHYWKLDLLALLEQLDLDVRNKTNKAPKKAPAKRKRTAARPLPRRVIKRQRGMTTIQHGF